MFKKHKLLFISLLAIGTMSLASCAGAKGEKGDTGPKGETGQNGQNGKDGKDGEDGEDGITWSSGEGEPNESVGKLGDFYLNTLTGDIYVKTSEGWILKMNIKGEDGEDGVNGSNGSNGANGKTAYSNTILPSTNGYVTVNKGSALVNEEITFEIHPNSGYELENFELDGVTPTETINYTDGVGYLTTTMKENGYVVSASFKSVSATAGKEVYFKDGVIYTDASVDGLGNVINEGTEGAKLFSSGNGTKESPLGVSNYDELKNISKIPDFRKNDIAYDEQIGFNFKLEDDIELTNSGVTNTFTGSFDGNNHTITFAKSASKVTRYLFYKVSSDTEIKNLNIVINSARPTTLAFSTWDTDYCVDDISFENINISTSDNTPISTTSSNFGFLVHNASYQFDDNKTSHRNIKNVHINANFVSSATSSSPFLGYGPMLGNDNIYVNYENCSYTGTFQGGDAAGLLWGNPSCTGSASLDIFKKYVTINNFTFNGTMSSNNDSNEWCGYVPNKPEYNAYIKENNLVSGEHEFIGSNKLKGVTGTAYFDTVNNTYSYGLDGYTLGENERLKLVFKVGAIKYSDGTESNGRNLLIDSFDPYDESNTNNIVLSKDNVSIYSRSSFKEAYPDFDLTTLNYSYSFEYNYFTAITYHDNKLCLIVNDFTDLDSVSGIGCYFYLFGENEEVVGIKQLF